VYNYSLLQERHIDYAFERSVFKSHNECFNDLNISIFGILLKSIGLLLKRLAKQQSKQTLVIY
jgi:hypothetical protein